MHSKVCEKHGEINLLTPSLLSTSSTFLSCQLHLLESAETSFDTSARTSVLKLFSRIGVWPENVSSRTSTLQAKQTTSSVKMLM